MQNDYNPQFNLSIETHEGVKHLHPLNANEAKILSKFALSGTPRKEIMRNFLHSIENQSSEKFAHIQKWIEGILAGDKTKFFTVQIAKCNYSQSLNTKYTVDQKFKETYVKIVGEEFADFRVDKDGLLEDRDAFIAYAIWEKKELELKASREQLENLKLENHCMIGQTWFMKGTPVANLIKHAEKVYKAEAIAQNSKIKFATDDNENWFAHDVPFYGTVQILKEFNEWDIHFNGCWQGPFESKSRCIQHLEECIQERREEQAQENAK